MAASPWPIPRRWPLATSRRARCHCPTRRLKKKNGNQQLYNSFYFVSDSSEVINLLFFPFSSPFFSNLQISAILMIFLSRMDDGLLLKYDMMILYSRNLSGFRFFRFFRISWNLQIFYFFYSFFTDLIICISNRVVCWFSSSHEIYPVSRC